MILSLFVFSAGCLKSVCEAPFYFKLINLFSIFDPSGGVGPFIINNWVVVLLWPFLLPPGF